MWGEGLLSLIESAPIRKSLEPVDMRMMNIGKRYWHVSLSKIDATAPHRKAIESYIKNIRDNIIKGRGVLFHGDYSTGKTASSIIIAKAVVMYGGTSYFIEVPELSDVKVTSKRFNDDMTVWERMESCDLLVLDDLGSAYGTDWAHQLVERIIRHRMNHCKSTIATTNKFKELKSIYDDGFVEVVSSSMLQVGASGKNWRMGEREQLRRGIMGDDES
jgi:DNA replication protein DnaC